MPAKQQDNSTSLIESILKIDLLDFLASIGALILSLSITDYRWNNFAENLEWWCHYFQFKIDPDFYASLVHLFTIVTYSDLLAYVAIGLAASLTARLLGFLAISISIDRMLSTLDYAKIFLFIPVLAFITIYLIPVINSIYPIV